MLGITNNINNNCINHRSYDTTNILGELYKKQTTLPNQIVTIETGKHNLEIKFDAFINWDIDRSYAITELEIEIDLIDYYNIDKCYSYNLNNSSLVDSINMIIAEDVEQSIKNNYTTTI